MSSVRDLGFGDVEREIVATRRVLERLPQQHFGWKPHAKSMNLGKLGMHVANLLQWSLDTLQRDELDMASPPEMRNEPTDRADLLRTFEQNATALQAALAKTDDDALTRTWSLKEGSEVLFAGPRAMILRVWCISHLIHHRAQLCLYLRLLNVPVPAVYFNSADEPDWVFE